MALQVWCHLALGVIGLKRSREKGWMETAPQTPERVSVSTLQYVRLKQVESLGPSRGTQPSQQHGILAV